MPRSRIFATAFVVADLICQARFAIGQQPEILWMSGGHSGGVSSVRFSPDSALLYSGGMGDNTVKVWRMSDGRLLRTINAYYSGVRSVAPSPGNGRYLAGAADANYGANDPTLKQWLPGDSSTRPGFKASQSIDLPSWSLAYSRDGSRIAVGNNRWEIDIYDAVSGNRLQTLFGHDWFTFDLAYSPDGKYLASASGDQTIKLWDATTGALIRTLTGHTFFVSGVAWSADSKTLVSDSYDGTVRFWDPATGVNYRTVDLGDESAMYSVDMAPDGTKVIAGGSDPDGMGAVHVIRASDGVVLQTLSPAHPGALFDLAYSPNGAYIASSGAESVINTWHASDGSYNRMISARRVAVPDVDVSPNGLLVADSAGYPPDGASLAVEIMQASDDKLQALCAGHFDVINAIDFSPDNAKIASGAGSPPPDTRDPSVRIWRVSDGQQLLQMAGHNGGTTGVDFHPSGARVASCGRDNKVKIWDANSGALIRTLSGHTNPVEAVRHSPDGALLASGGQDGKLIVWDANTGANLRSVSIGSAITSLAYSSDGSLIALGYEGYGSNVQIRRASDLSLVRTIDADPYGFIYQVQFSPDMSELATTSGYTHRVRLWRVSDGALLANYDTETGWGPAVVMPLRFHPHGKRFFIGRADGTLVMAFDPTRMLTSSPTSFKVIKGGVLSGNLASVQLSDDARMVLSNHPASFIGGLQVMVEFEATSPVSNPSQLQVKLENQVSEPLLEQNVELYDFVLGAYVSVDIRPGMLDDSVATGYVRTPSRFVEAGSKKIRARLTVTKKSPASVPIYQTSIDQVIFNIAP